MARDFPAVVALPDGRVLVIGGLEGDDQVSRGVDVYNPASRSWSAAAPLPFGRYLSAAVLLPDGRVLVAGGIARLSRITGDPIVDRLTVAGSPGPTDRVDIYDPAADTWEAAASLPEPLSSAAAVVLSDGRVMTAGGGNRDDRRTTLFYDSSSDRWTMGPRLADPRSAGTLTRFDDGRVLLSGGTLHEQGVATAEIFDPIANRWTQAGRMSTGRARATTGVLADGRVIVAGGATPAGGIPRADIFDPATGQWHVTRPMMIACTDAAGGLLRDGTFFVAGGTTPRDAALDASEPRAVIGPGGISRGVQVYDPSSDTWSWGTSMIQRRSGAGAIVVDGNLLVAGGGELTAEIYVLNKPPVAIATVQATAAGLPDAGAAVAVSAHASSDPDGDFLSYTWTEDGATLAATMEPTRAAVVALPIGAHVLTLTVRDAFGGVSTATGTTIVVDGTAGYVDQIAALNARIRELTQSMDAHAAAVEQDFRIRFADPTFTVPGASPDARLGAIVNAILALPAFAKNVMYLQMKMQ